MKKSSFLMTLVSVLALSASSAFASSTPPLNLNEWNFILVPQFEKDTKSKDHNETNNLSSYGFNHALQFGQTLNILTAGKASKVEDIYAFTQKGNDKDMAPLGTLQPYALLNNLNITATSLDEGDISVYNSPAYFINNIIMNQKKGIYIMSMPNEIVQNIATYFTGKSLPSNMSHQYFVVSGNQGNFKLNSYTDDLKVSNKYPEVKLKNNNACPEKSVTITAKKPKGLKTYPEQTVHFIRHVEAHPNGNFENGNYVCQGQWRAIGANDILLKLMDNKKPDYIIASNPSNIMDCDMGACSYIRPIMTVAPFATQHNLPITIPPFQWGDEEDLAESLFNQTSPYNRPEKKGSSILVGWEHVHIEEAVKYLFATMYKDPKAAAQIPEWNYLDYDTVWKVQTDKEGNITFTNSCEGIDTNYLPSTCPAFFPE